MASFLASRLKKLEARRAKPSVVRGSVVRFTPEGRVLGPVPPRPCMVVTTWPSDEAWSQALRRQQAELTQRP
jgi:hypothetical protein